MYPKEYIDFLIHFHCDRDYFECHEILEEYWKRVDPRNKDSIWVGFILFAVANYHHRRGNFNGAAKSYPKSIEILKEHQEKLNSLGIDGKKLLSDLENRNKDALEGRHYFSYHFPFSSSSLLVICKETCEQKNLKWGSASDLTNDQIIHRHSLRDRTQVINDRLAALKKNESNR